jgi:hypothetical protein
MHTAKAIGMMVLVSFATIAIANRVAFLRKALKTDV